MSRIVLLTFGTYGDVAPYVGLGVRLQEAGHEVAIASQQPYQGLIQEHGLEYRYLPKDTEQATRESPQAQAFIDGERMTPSREMTRQMVADMDGVGPAMVEASAGADLLLASGPVGALFGYHIAQGMRIPSAALYLQPLAATRELAPPALTTRSFGGVGNRLVWRIAAKFEGIYLDQINQVRTSVGLTAARVRDFQRERDASWPMVFGFSEHVVPRPRDWAARHHITGYWWPTTPRDFTPPAELADFLAAGPPPVFVGFGSTATGKGAELGRMLVETAERGAARLVVQPGWAHLGDLDSDRIITVGSLPHEWLFPRMAAVVHHAGAGTTAATLRAGVPSVPVPGIMDQPYWARRLVDLGVAPALRRRPDLDAGWLVDAIHAAVTDPRYAERARGLSAALAAEDGAGAAVELSKKLLAWMELPC